MRTVAEMRATLERAYKLDFADKPDAYVVGFYERSCASGVRLDAAGNVNGDPDPGDHAHRSAVGSTSAVRTPGEMPNLAGLDLGALKRIAAALGAYDAEVREELGQALLERLRELGADQLADNYAELWADGLGLRVDDDDTDEDAARRRLASASATAYAGRGRSKADALAASSPIAAKRRIR